ncbi:MAG TPA: hypothetical protein VGI17_09070 [Solirubrobacterales bacterium]
MRLSIGARLLRGAAAVAALLAVSAAAAPAGASAAGVPTFGVAFSTEVVATSARLHGEVNPQGSPTAYHFEYLSEAQYEANLGAGRDGFSGASRVPGGAEANAGAGSSLVPVSQTAAGLTPSTPYRYRVVARNAAGIGAGVENVFIAQALGGGSPLLDGRAWEMVSPAEKNGAQVGAPESIFGGGDLQAAAGGGAFTFSSLGSFGGGVAGAPPASQYLSTRGSSGWVTRNVTAAVPSGSYGDEPDGTPYRLFSGDLGRALMLDGRRCQEGEQCPRSYSLRTGEGSPPAGTGAVAGLELAAATPDLAHMVFAADDELYEWSGGALLGIGAGVGAAPASPNGAISTDGRRVYWVGGTGDLNLWEAGSNRSVDASATADFQIASADGAVALYLKEGTLLRYAAASGTSQPIATEVTGVLGASADGSVVFFQTATGLARWRAGTTSTVALGTDAALAGDWPPATGTSRVSADGSALAFLSTARLTGYDNTDQGTGHPDSELFLWSESGGLVCASCNPTNERPLGPTTIPGAIANGSTNIYKPRVVAAGGRRLFFDSADALVLSDANAASDAYEWEAAGTGSCTGPGGCIGLVSSGRAERSATFLDASESGGDAYFLTDRSLVGTDSSAFDVYDAREDGGFPESSPPLACEGDSCQALPPEPEDPAPGTLNSGPGNLKEPAPAAACPKGKTRVKRKGKSVCVVRKKAKHPKKKQHKAKGKHHSEGGKTKGGKTK